MGHAKEIITVDVYGDNEEIILSGVEEIEEFIKEVIPQNNKEIEVDIDRTSVEAINIFIEDISIQTITQ